MTVRSYNLRSDISALSGLSNTYLKRDDELSFGVSGSKWRKLSSLVHTLAENRQRSLWLVGGINSNSVLAASQQFREAQLAFQILTTPYHHLHSNGILAMQVLDPQQIKVVQSAALPATMAALRRLAAAKQLTLIEEGLDHPAAYVGAASLSQDLQRNERELGIGFHHVVMDAGTGISAAALIIGDALAGIARHYHIVLIAGDEEYFARQFAKVAASLPGAAGLQLTAIPLSFYRPKVGRSFGSIPAAVWQTIKRVARAEGILLDPLYTAKTYGVLEEIAPALSGPKVMIHTGGGLSLAGFLGKLSP